MVIKYISTKKLTHMYSCDYCHKLMLQDEYVTSVYFQKKNLSLHFDEVCACCTPTHDIIPNV